MNFFERLECYYYGRSNFVVWWIIFLLLTSIMIIGLTFYIDSIELSNNMSHVEEMVKKRLGKRLLYISILPISTVFIAIYKDYKKFYN